MRKGSKSALPSSNASSIPQSVAGTRWQLCGQPSLKTIIAAEESDGWAIRCCSTLGVTKVVPYPDLGRLRPMHYSSAACRADLDLGSTVAAGRGDGDIRPIHSADTESVNRTQGIHRAVTQFDPVCSGLLGKG